MCPLCPGQHQVQNESIGYRVAKGKLWVLDEIALDSFDKSCSFLYLHSEDYILAQIPLNVDPKSAS